MEVIQRTIKCGRGEKFTLFPIGDCHLGVVHCDEDLLRKTVREIRDNPNALWIGMGDYADCVTPSDFKRWDGRILADWMKGNEDNIGATQCDHVHEMFSPIWDKCLGLIEGNHEESIRKYNHYNMITELIKRSGVPYAGVSSMFALNFSRSSKGEGCAKSVVIHARHGEGSARTSGARALAVLRLASVFVNAHITLMGHLHGQESPDISQRLILRDGKIIAFESIATMTGAWVKAYAQGVPPSYLERWGSPPSVLGCPRIAITPFQSGGKDSYVQMTLEKAREMREV